MDNQGPVDVDWGMLIALLIALIVGCAMLFPVAQTMF